MPKFDENGREFIEQDGKRYYRTMFGGWEAEKDIFGHEKVNRDLFGNVKIDTDLFGHQRIERDWLGRPYVEPEKKDDSGCYLTTACLRALRSDFDDNCEELTILRGFRDSFVRERHPEAIKEYYRIAPGIVGEIQKRANHQEIFETIYRELVEPCVALIKEGHLVDAYELYSAYSRSLETAFCPAV